jgi:hypothetical protein
MRFVAIPPEEYPLSASSRRSFFLHPESPKATFAALALSLPLPFLVVAVAFPCSRLCLSLSLPLPFLVVAVACRCRCRCLSFCHSLWESASSFALAYLAVLPHPELADGKATCFSTAINFP